MFLNTAPGYVKVIYITQNLWCKWDVRKRKPSKKSCGQTFVAFPAWKVGKRAVKTVPKTLCLDDIIYPKS